MMLQDIQIQMARDSQIAECLAILSDSILGTYFDPPLASEILTAATTKQELFVAVSDEGVLGFYVSVSRGSFLVFPYVHLLAVKTSVRSLGVGATLLEHLETSTLNTPGYPFRPKIFLLVAQTNERAVRFYERHGYVRTAVIDDMFADGDTEFLMMKDLGKKPGPQ